jgi:cyclophilin family peptidyl-prolyl cis-trans isomerase
MIASGRIALRAVRIITITSLLIAAVLMAACGGDDDSGDNTTTAAAEEPACTEAERPDPKAVDVDKPPKRPSENGLVAVVETNCGAFEIALDTRGNPKTAASFEHLANEGVYDGTWFHRIVPGFVIQGGDPDGTGTGGPGYSVVEAPPRDAEYTRGVVAMAKTQAEEPGTSGSQFFVVTGADAGLPPDYAIVGKVRDGMDVVRTIESFGDPSGQSEEPLAPVVIESVTIESRGS